MISCRPREQELRRVQGVAARATYFAAWSNYYLGLVTQAAPGAEPYVQARDIFLHLLGFEDSLPDDLEPEWLGLESIWRARSVIGLGLSLAACGELDASGRCFEMLEQGSVPPEIKEQAPYWYVRRLAGRRAMGTCRHLRAAENQLLSTATHARQSQPVRRAGASRFWRGHGQSPTAPRSWVTSDSSAWLDSDS